MPYIDNISQAINLGRRLNSINRVANRWNIKPSEAAELMINVEKEQTEYKLKLTEKFSKIHEGKLDIKCLDKCEYKLFIEGETFKPIILESERYRMKDPLDSSDKLTDSNTCCINNSEVFKKNDSINSNTILIDPEVLMIENNSNSTIRNRMTINSICCCF